MGEKEGRARTRAFGTPSCMLELDQRRVDGARNQASRDINFLPRTCEVLGIVHANRQARRLSIEFESPILNEAFSRRREVLYRELLREVWPTGLTIEYPKRMRASGDYTHGPRGADLGSQRSRHIGSLIEIA